MKRTFSGVIPLITVLLLSLSSVAEAHRIRVFAYKSGDEIITEASFSSGRPAKDAAVEVKSKNGTHLLSGKTDDQGSFRFQITHELRNAEGLSISVDLGEGHRGSWNLSEADLILSAGETDHTHDSDIHHAVESRNKPEKCASDQETEEMLERIIVQELEPVKKILLEQSEHRVSFRDILGGLGYIFGIAGIVTYMKSKQKE